MATLHKGFWRRLRESFRTLPEKVLVRITTGVIMSGGAALAVWFGTSIYQNAWVQVLSVFLALALVIFSVFLCLVAREFRKQSTSLLNTDDSTACGHHFLNWASPRGVVAHVVGEPTLLVNQENSHFCFGLCIHNQTDVDARMVKLSASHVGASIPDCRNLPATLESEVDKITISAGRCQTIPGIQFRVDIRDARREQLYEHTSFCDPVRDEGMIEFGFHILKIHLNPQDGENSKEVVVAGPQWTHVSYADMDSFSDPDEDDL